MEGGLALFLIWFGFLKFKYMFTCLKFVDFIIGMADLWSNLVNHDRNGCWHTNEEGGTTAKRTSNRGALTSIRPQEVGGRAT
jgi:hypothetical protein